MPIGDERLATSSAVKIVSSLLPEGVKHSSGPSLAISGLNIPCLD